MLICIIISAALGEVGRQVLILAQHLSAVDRLAKPRNLPIRAASRPERGDF